MCKSWKSQRPLATLTTKPAERPGWYRYGRLLLLVLPSALCPSLRATGWANKRRELSLLNLVRHCPAVAERGRQGLFASAAALRSFLQRVCAPAERLVIKASRPRRTTAHILRDSLSSHNNFFEPALALAA